MSRGFSGAGDQVVDRVGVATVVEVNIDESRRTLPAITPLESASLRRPIGSLCQITVLGPKWLKATKRLDHRFVHLTTLTGRLEFVSPLLNVFIVKRRGHGKLLLAELTFLFFINVVLGFLGFFGLLPFVCYLFGSLPVERRVEWPQ